MNSTNEKASFFGYYLPLDYQSSLPQRIAFARKLNQSTNICYNLFRNHKIKRKPFSRKKIRNIRHKLYLF